MSSYLVQRQAAEIAQTILAGFNRHYTLFRSQSAKAKGLFEERKWLAIQKLIADRISMYDTRVEEAVSRARERYSARAFTEEVWKEVKLAYIMALVGHPQPELAETFFNSVSTKLLGKNYFSNDFLFMKPAISTEYIEAAEETFAAFYPNQMGLRNTIREMLESFAWNIPFAEIKQDIKNILTSAMAHFKGELPFSELNLHFKLLRSPFYRNKSAYILGQIVNGHARYPFAFAVLNNPKGELYIDAAIFDPGEIAVLFGSSRAYFLVEMEVPSAYVHFLQSMLPMRQVADFYTMLGLQKQSKNIFFRDFHDHLRYSTDHFIAAPGVAGLVMLVFTLPSFPYVFKVIKDFFGPNKNFDQNYVRHKYELVKKHDRVGRLADTLEYTNVAIPLDRLDPELLEALKKEAPSVITMRDDNLIIKHVYIERRLKPLNLFMQTATPAQKEALVIEYGNTLRDLATANIFPGDMLYKNFGVTRYGRLIFYDYDEIEYMTNCNFKKIPPAPNPEYELSDEVWYPVHKGDVFPEEFAPFLLGDPEVREVFLEHHKELLTPEFWQEKKNNILAGIVDDFYPYNDRVRFHLTAKQKGEEKPSAKNKPKAKSAKKTETNPKSGAKAAKPRKQKDAAR